MLSTTDGAQTSLYCATSPDVAQDSGLFYDKCAKRPPSGVATPELAAELWKRSETWAATLWGQAGGGRRPARYLVQLPDHQPGCDQPGHGADATIQTALPGDIDLRLFPGSDPENTVTLTAAGNPVIQFDIDFAVSRNGSTNQQSFGFFIYDASHERIPNFISSNAVGANPGVETGNAVLDHHSIVNIDPTNEVYIQDNTSATAIDTGVSLAWAAPTTCRPR